MNSLAPESGPRAELLVRPSLSDGTDACEPAPAERDRASEAREPTHDGIHWTSLLPSKAPDFESVGMARLLRATLLFSVVTSFGLSLGEHAHSLERYGLVSFGAASALLLVAAWRHAQPDARIATVYMICAASLLLSGTYVGAWKAIDGTLPEDALSPVGSWTPIFVVLAFVFFERKRASKYAAMLAIGLAAPILVFVALRIQGEFRASEMRLLHVHLIALPAFVGLAYIVAHLKVAFRESESARKSAEVAALTDPLTGVLNRRGFINGSLLVRAEHEPHHLIMVDMDRFKEINDEMGHEVGDRVLRSIAATLTAHCRSDDLVGRWGGEEFVVLVRRCKDPASALALAEKLRRRISMMVDPSLAVTASLGVAQGTDDFEETIRRADRALYFAKGRGRDCVAQWSEVVRAPATHPEVGELDSADLDWPPSSGA